MNQEAPVPLSIKPARRSGWVIFGAIVSISYLGGIVFVLISDNVEAALHLKQPVEFTLNTLGDFLAGVCAPLAFLWLFVATMVQSQELALQREELSLTRLEFQQSREVAKQQAAEAKSQAAFIGAQTKIIQSGEIDKLIDVRIDGFMRMQWSLGAIIASTENSEVNKIVLGVKPDRELSYASEAFVSWADSAKRWEDKNYKIFYEFENQKEIAIGDVTCQLQSISDNLDKASEQKKAELENAGFIPLLDALKYLNNVATPR
ncbi:hypothetical protein ACWGTI_18940 [Mesorhizobium sp. ArgA1]